MSKAMLALIAFSLMELSAAVSFADQPGLK
jgi:hypothetical protein